MLNDDKQWKLDRLIMENTRFLLITIFCRFLVCCSGTCTLPASLRGLWISSEKNELTFADTSLSGYQVATFSTDNFTCVESSDTKYMLKSEVFRRFGLQFYAYLCLDFQQVTRVSSGDLYIYYKASPEQADADNERVVFKLATFPTPAMSEVCTVTDYTNVRYSILMKNGTIDTVKTKCPIPFLGNFRYSYDTGSGNLCNSSLVTVCSGDKTTMTWDYTKCSQIQAYSAGGVTKCVHATTSSNVYTVHVYNMDDSTDQSTTYRFTCYQATGYETVYATQYPGDCPSSQNQTYVESPGGALVLRANLVCAYDETSSVLSAGVIAAIVIICVIIVIVIIVLIIYYFYNKRKKKRIAEWEAANRKVDPDELSPNMRLGLPDETRYDLDRLMYSPENMKTGLIKKTSRKDMMAVDGLEGYNDGTIYMDEDQRQTALEAHMFAEKRKRRDAKDEFKVAEKTNKVFSDRIKELAKGRKRPVRAATLAKLKFRPKARPKTETPDGSEGGRATQTKDIVIQVEEADAKGENKRKTRFADEEKPNNAEEKTDNSKKAKKLEDVETLSDIADNENAVDDLSDEDKEPRLVLPNLRQDKKNRKKRPKDRFSLGSNPQTPGMPHNTRYMPPKSRQKSAEQEEYPQPLLLSKPDYSSLPPLARIHRKDNPRAWKEAFGENTNGMESMDIETMKKKLPENRWKKLLEELYRDKKYFDYVKNTTSTSEKDLLASADESLQYLYGRALFWELQQPIPARPPSHVKRMFSRYEPPKSSQTLQRSSTTMSRSGHKRVARTPSTQVSRLKKRENVDKKKNNLNNANVVANGLSIPEYFEGGTQTDFSPIPLTPVMIADDNVVERLSIPATPIEERNETPVIPFTKEITRSDIKLEEFDNNLYDEEDPNFMYQPFEDEEENVKVAV